MGTRYEYHCHGRSWFLCDGRWWVVQADGSEEVWSIATERDKVMVAEIIHLRAILSKIDSAHITAAKMIVDAETKGTTDADAAHDKEDDQ